ncbi:hypothetical protein BVRB_6g141060 [Beta vulgaris subsp. vulgaris]|nr:hypothetical protein BVRB_6g141060 [Beta vulgaris subsp. vulgaris]
MTFLDYPNLAEKKSLHIGLQRFLVMDLKNMFMTLHVEISRPSHLIGV